MNVQPVKGIETTYNLTVLDNHTFYVGEDKIWIHNAGKNCDCEVNAQNLAKKGIPAISNDKLTPIGLWTPVPLLPSEIQKIVKWQAVKKSFADKWAGANFQEAGTVETNKLDKALEKMMNNIRII